MGTLMDDNARLQREISQRVEESAQLKLELAEKNKQTQDLKATLKQTEQQLAGFHQAAVSQASETILKHEQHRTRLEDLLKEH
jgi:predicted RNase H-like nuclease (RuvC/YqgF family)